MIFAKITSDAYKKVVEMFIWKEKKCIWYCKIYIIIRGILLIVVYIYQLQPMMG